MEFIGTSYKDRRKSPCEAEEPSLRICFEIFASATGSTSFRVRVRTSVLQPATGHGTAVARRCVMGEDANFLNCLNCRRMREVCLGDAFVYADAVYCGFLCHQHQILRGNWF